MPNDVTEIKLDGRGIPATRKDGVKLYVRRITLHDGEVEWVDGDFLRVETIRGARGDRRVGQSIAWQGYPEDLREARELERFIGKAVNPATAERFAARIGKERS